MLCPVCKSTPLEDRELESGLKGYGCSNCNGSWIRYCDYEEWKNICTEENRYTSGPDIFNLEYDTKKASLCPDCGRILIKYKVSSSLPFYVDHCGSCSGVWLDQKEWEALLNSDLQYSINSFFTSSWQEKIRKEMTRKRFEDSYRNKFGEENYQKLKEIREWIYSSEQKGELLSYLIDEDPYKI